MKRISYFKKIVVLTGICIFCSCNRYEYHTITIAIDDNCTLEQQTAAYEVINKRLSIWEINEKTDLVDGKFDLTYRVGKQSNSNTDSLWTQIFTQRGEIYIAETYQYNEISSAVLSVYEKIPLQMENSNEKPLWIRNIYEEDPVVVYASLQYLHLIDSVFNSNINLFPFNISFYWTANPNNEYFNLIAIKSSRPFPLNPNSVKNSKIVYRGNSREIDIELKEEYHKKWERLTRNNISKSLAIIMDGKVLMYPTVNSEITGGKLSIAGKFENNEFLLIQSVILGGTLDCKGQIVNK